MLPVCMHTAFAPLVALHCHACLPSKPGMVLVRTVQPRLLGKSAVAVHCGSVLLTHSQLELIIAAQSVCLQGGLVVAEVISVKAHPKADRLRVCSVDYGHDVAQVVTNAANVAEGMKVIFAVRAHGDTVEMVV